jgi:S1-C subfamily serine protease
VLHVRITLTDAARMPVPVARHALLISEDPVGTAPRRVVTGPDGTVDVTLLPGRYIVESDRPAAFGGQGYQWTQRVLLTAGRTITLELTAANAETGTAPVAVDAAPAAPAPDDDSVRLRRAWADSVVGVWTSTSRASGFVVDRSGLVITHAGVTGGPSAEVQLTPAVKVAARVLVTDQSRGVAVLLIDPAVLTSVRPIPLDCASAAPAFAPGQPLLALGAPLRGANDVATGEVIGVERQAPVADFALTPAETGGPVFTAAGTLIGLSSLVDGSDRRRESDARVVTTPDLCAVMSAAQRARPAAPAPTAARLPVELSRPFPAATLEAALRDRAGAAAPYTMSSSDFDIAFLTPVIIYGAQHAPPAATNRFGVREAEAQPRPLVDPTDFGDWSDYFEDGPSVLVVRVTPKFEEGFWTRVARGAASTQGVALPPIKRFRPGFSRLRAFCGESEVMPIHPFVLAQRVSESDAIREGLYVFDPLAFGPHCGTVRLGLFSEKAPAKEDLRVVDPSIVERIWRDSTSFSGR